MNLPKYFYQWTFNMDILLAFLHHLLTSNWTFLEPNADDHLPTPNLIFKFFWFPLSICTWFLQLSSLTYRVWWTGFFSQFELDFSACCSLIKVLDKQVHQSRYFKLENVKYQVQIDRRIELKCYLTPTGLTDFAKKCI